MDSLPVEDAIAQYRRFKNFYFDFVSDPERESKFHDKLGKELVRLNAH
jgi:hypothetical protein